MHLVLVNIYIIWGGGGWRWSGWLLVVGCFGFVGVGIFGYSLLSDYQLLAVGLLVVGGGGWTASCLLLLSLALLVLPLSLLSFVAWP